MILVECWLDIGNNGNIIVSEEATPYLKVEEGDEFVAFVRDGRVIFVKKSNLNHGS